jgi:hypothetical protein
MVFTHKKFATHNWFHRNFGRFFTIFNSPLFLASPYYGKYRGQNEKHHQIGMIRHSNRSDFFAVLRFTNAILMVECNTKLRVIVQMHERRINKPFFQSSALETAGACFPNC